MSSINKIPLFNFPNKEITMSPGFSSNQ